MTHAAVVLARDDALGFAVDDVDRERRALRRIDDDLVVEDRMRVGRTDVIDEVERRVAAPPDGPRRPRAHRHFDDVARVQIGPSNEGTAPAGALLFGKRDGAVFAMHTREQELRVVALGGDLFLEEILFGARLDHDLARVVHHLRDALVGVVGDGAHPVELAIHDLALLRRVRASRARGTPTARRCTARPPSSVRSSAPGTMRSPGFRCACEARP